MATIGFQVGPTCPWRTWRSTCCTWTAAPWHASYEARRELLQNLELEAEHWQTPPFSIGGGEAMREASREQGMERRRRQAPRESVRARKRTGAWLKVKNVHRQEFVIGGWIPGRGRRSGGLGSVVVGYYQDGKLISAGGVGTGFTNQMLVEMAKLLEPLARDTSPFDSGHVPKETRFVEPRLVCEVEFAEWTTRSGELRHPSFKGLRWEKEVADVVREDA